MQVLDGHFLAIHMNGLLASYGNGVIVVARRTAVKTYSRVASPIVSGVVRPTGACYNATWIDDRVSLLVLLPHKKALTMYLGSRPRRRSPRLIILLLLMILAATLMVNYIATHRPAWSTPFEPTPTATRPARSYVAEAEAYYGEGQLDEAISAYQQAANRAPADPAIHIRLAQMLILRERSAEAAHEARQAVMLAPSNPQAIAIWCRALDWEGQYTDALGACECAVEMDPNDAEAYAYLSEVYSDLGNWAAARGYAQQAVDLDYQSMDAHRNQGYAYEMQGRFSKAVEAYENAIYLQPKLASLYVSAGRNYRALNKFKEAIDRFEKVIRIDPASPVGYDQLGWTYYAQGDYNRAIEYLEQATTIAPEYAQAWGHLGIVNYVMQQYEDAIVFFQKAIQLSDRDYLNRARQIIVLGQDATFDPPRAIELMRGDFYPMYRKDVETLTADIYAVLPETKTVPQAGQTCGDTIASRVAAQMGTLEERPTGRPSAAGTPLADNASQRARGQAVIDVKSGRVEVRLSGMNQSAVGPYEVQMLMWPGKTVELGEPQLDQNGNAAFAFSFQDAHPAPVEYYYSLGFSYLHLDQCNKGVPWLLISLEIDSGVSNPAWQGLDECPDYLPAIELTPPPTSTPAPE